MIEQLTKVLVVALACIATGCASIVGKSHYPVSFNSEPSGAHVQVVDEDGVRVFDGTTPATTSLRSGESYFDRKSYGVTFTKAGYGSQISNIRSTVTPWYWFGNIFVGGLIGWFIVDPISGSMYEIENPNIHASLPVSNPAAASEGTAPVAENTVAAKLKELAKLLSEGVITGTEYEKKKQELLRRM